MAEAVLDPKERMFGKKELESFLWVTVTVFLESQGYSPVEGIWKEFLDVGFPAEEAVDLVQKIRQYIYALGQGVLEAEKRRSQLAAHPHREGVRRVLEAREGEESSTPPESEGRRECVQRLSSGEEGPSRPKSNEVRDYGSSWGCEGVAGESPRRGDGDARGATEEVVKTSSSSEKKVAALTTRKRALASSETDESRKKLFSASHGSALRHRAAPESREVRPASESDVSFKDPYPRNRSNGETRGRQAAIDCCSSEGSVRWDDELDSKIDAEASQAGRWSFLGALRPRNHVRRVFIKCNRVIESMEFHFEGLRVEFEKSNVNLAEAQHQLRELTAAYRLSIKWDWKEPWISSLHRVAFLCEEYTKSDYVSSKAAYHIAALCDEFINACYIGKDTANHLAYLRKKCLACSNCLVRKVKLSEFESQKCADGFLESCASSVAQEEASDDEDYFNSDSGSEDGGCSSPAKQQPWDGGTSSGKGGFESEIFFKRDTCWKAQAVKKAAAGAEATARDGMLGGHTIPGLRAASEDASSDEEDSASVSEGEESGSSSASSSEENSSSSDSAENARASSSEENSRASSDEEHSRASSREENSSATSDPENPTASNVEESSRTWDISGNSRALGSAENSRASYEGENLRESRSVRNESIASSTEDYWISLRCVRNRSASNTEDYWISSRSVRNLSPLASEHDSEPSRSEGSRTSRTGGFLLILGDRLISASEENLEALRILGYGYASASTTGGAERAASREDNWSAWNREGNSRVTSGAETSRASNRDETSRASSGAENSRGRDSADNSRASSSAENSRAWDISGNSRALSSEDNSSIWSSEENSRARRSEELSSTWSIESEGGVGGERIEAEADTAAFDESKGVYPALHAPKQEAVADIVRHVGASERASRSVFAWQEGTAPDGSVVGAGLFFPEPLRLRGVFWFEPRVVGCSEAKTTPPRRQSSLELGVVKRASHAAVVFPFDSNLLLYTLPKRITLHTRRRSD